MDLRALRYFVSLAEAARFSTGERPSARDGADLSRTLSKLAVVPRIGRGVLIAPARLPVPRIQSPVEGSAMQRRCGSFVGRSNRSWHAAGAAATAPIAPSGRR